jgi:mannan endo-1,4-beta-mannosidase
MLTALALSGPSDAVAVPEQRATLAVSADGHGLVYGGRSVFLAGANQAWRHYGQDWGNAHPAPDDYCALKRDLIELSRAGGNSIRFWVFIEGAHIPQWGADNQTVLAGDNAGTLASSMRRYTRLAASLNILVTWCLWNGAGGDRSMDPRVRAMIEQPSGTTLASFINAALVPLVKALAAEAGLGAWEIMNEPEGSVSLTAGVGGAEPCFDPARARGVGWAGNNIPLRYLQRFVAAQAAAIHAADPSVLVTVGSANPTVIRSDKPFFNYWSDDCLGKALAGFDEPENVNNTRFLDFYQAHIYPGGANHNGSWDSYSPFFGGGYPKALLGLDKPLVLGEFPMGHTIAAGTQTPTQLYEYAYAGGYDGGWGWCMCTKTDGGCKAADNAGNLGMISIGKGLAGLRGYGERIHITVGGPAPIPDSCTPVPPSPPFAPQPPQPCTDVPPLLHLKSCAQHAKEGGCEATSLRGYCCRSCWNCTGILQCGGRASPAAARNTAARASLLNYLKILNDTDFPSNCGNPYAPSQSLEHCAALCTARPDCVATIFVEAGAASACAFKCRSDNPVPKPGITAVVVRPGKATCTLPPPPPPHPPPPPPFTPPNAATDPDWLERYEGANLLHTDTAFDGALFPYIGNGYLATHPVGGRGTNGMTAAEQMATLYVSGVFNGVAVQSPCSAGYCQAPARAAVPTHRAVLKDLPLLSGRFALDIEKATLSRRATLPGFSHRGGDVLFLPTVCSLCTYMTLHA